MTAIRKRKIQNKDNDSKVIPITRERTLDDSQQETSAKQRIRRPQPVSHLVPGLLKSPSFLLLVSLTIMNAFLYVYLAGNDFPSLTKSAADAVIRETFGRDYTFFSPISEFLSESEKADEISYPEFRGSVDRLNQNIARLGLYTGAMLNGNSFKISHGGIYWTPSAFQGHTKYRPQVDGH